MFRSYAIIYDVLYVYTEETDTNTLMCNSKKIIRDIRFQLHLILND